MPQDVKRQRSVRAWILLAIGLGASGMAGCAAGKLNVTVDAYKGPLSNHGDTLVLQGASLAEAARLQLTNIRGSYLTIQEFKAFIPGSEVWLINRLLEMYDDPTPDSGREPVAAPTAPGLRAEEAVGQIEELLRELDRHVIKQPEEKKIDETARKVSDLITRTLGEALGSRTRAEIDQMAYAWIRNRQGFVRKISDPATPEAAKKEAKENQEKFRHQMIDVLTNAGRFGIFSQRIPKTESGRRGIDHLIDQWLQKLDASRRQAESGEASPGGRKETPKEAEEAEARARERLLDGLTVLGEAMRTMALVMGGQEFLEQAADRPHRDDRVDLILIGTLDAFGNALLFASDSARQEAGFARRMGKQPSGEGGTMGQTEREWRRRRARELETKRAKLEDELLESLAKGVEDLKGNLSDEQVKDRAQSRGRERAIRMAQTMPPPLERLRPAGEYLRAQRPGAILLEQLGKKDEKAEKITSRLINIFDALYWERVSEVKATGLAKANYVLYKDDIGNWNLKAYSDDRTLLVKAVFGSVIAAADLALKAASGGSAEVTALIAERIRKLKETSTGPSVSAETIRRQVADARTALVKQVLPDEQKPETILLTNEKLRTAVTKATAGDAVSQALEEYQRSLTVIRAGVIPTSEGP